MNVVERAVLGAMLIDKEAAPKALEILDTTSFYNPTHAKIFRAMMSLFEKGDPIYIIEVMKMFNKISAPFAGTIDEVLVPDDGVVVRKGQPLFKVSPDERVVEVDPAELRTRLRRASEDLIAGILPAKS